MPHLRELLFRCAGMTFATALDLIMGYFGIWLKEHVKDLCTIILPFGKFRYNVLPMGLKISADVFQRELSTLFDDIYMILVYIDAILKVTKGTYEEHLEIVKEALNRLQKKGL